MLLQVRVVATLCALFWAMCLSAHGADGDPLAGYSTLLVSGDFGFLEPDGDGPDSGVFPGAFGGLIGFDMASSRWSTVGGGLPFLDCDGNPNGYELLTLIPVRKGDLGGQVDSADGVLVGGFIGNSSLGVSLDGLAVWNVQAGTWGVIGTPGLHARGYGAASLSLAPDKSALAVTGWWDSVGSVAVNVSAAVWSGQSGWVPLDAPGLSTGGVLDHVSQLCISGQNKTKLLAVDLPFLTYAPDGDLIMASNFRTIPGVGSLVDAGFLPGAALISMDDDSVAAGSSSSSSSIDWAGLIPIRKGTQVYPSTLSCPNYSGKLLPLYPLDDGKCRALMDVPPSSLPASGWCCTFSLPASPFTELCGQPTGGTKVSKVTAVPGAPDTWIISGSYNVSGMTNTLMLSSGSLGSLPPVPGTTATSTVNVVPVLADVSDTPVAVMAWWADAGVTSFTLLNPQSKTWGAVYTTAPGELSIFALTTIRLLPASHTLIVSGIRDKDHQDGPQGTILMYSRPVTPEPGAVVVGSWLNTPFSTLRNTTNLVYASNGFVPHFTLTPAGSGPFLDPHIPPFCGRPAPAIH